MTCIVGLVHKEKVYIGGDSAGVGGYSLSNRADEKIFHNKDFIMGFTTSFRMGQLLRFKFIPPYHKPEKSTYEYMVVDFVEEVRQCLKDGGYASNDKGEEIGGTFLVGYKGELFTIEADYQVGRQIEGYDAVGCGSEIAKGSLYSTSVLDPEERVKQALQASENFSAGVRGPFHIISTE